MRPLLLASVLATGVGQVLFVFIALRRRWYSRVVRALVALFALASSAGAFWFVGGTLVGIETTLVSALLFAGPQAIALWLIMASSLKEVFRIEHDSEAIGGRLDRASEEAEDRFSEAELEKREVRERLDRAALVSRGELDVVKRELEEKLDEAIRLLRKLGGRDGVG